MHFVGGFGEAYRARPGGAVSEERQGELLPTMERILDCLDLSELPKELRDTAGIESALFLKEVLDRTDLPAGADIPGFNPESNDAESLLRWQIPGTRMEIARIELCNEADRLTRSFLRSRTFNREARAASSS